VEPIRGFTRLEGGGISANVRMTDSSDFETTAIPYLDNVFRTAYALCGRRSEAEDLVQATYLKALGQFGSFRPGTNCKAWLLRILRNSWIDRLRHRKVVGTELQVEKLPLAAAESVEESHWANPRDILNNFADEQIIEALNELPEAQRLVVFLVDVEEMPLDQVAEILDVAVGTVKSRASRARAKLKTRLMAHAADLGFDGRVKQ
jgi:RNA polymerase sigma-70 factor, ECF subfamily